MGKKPTPAPSTSYGPAVAGNNAIQPTPAPTVKPTPKPSASTATKPTPTPTVKAPGTGTTDPIKPIAKGVQSDYSAFTNGSIVLNSGGSTGGVQSEPYVSTVPTGSNTQPKALVVLPHFDAGGTQTGFTVTDIDAEVDKIIGSLPRANIDYYKTQLQKYYPSTAAYKVSITAGPMTDKDLGFQQAIKKALMAASVDNYNTGKQIAEQVAKGGTATAKMYGFESFVASRIQTPNATSASDRSSGLTVKEDAYAEFDRTVKQYVGNPTLVDEVKKLREEYWTRLHNAELNRQSTSTSTTDPLGNRVTNTTAYAQMSEQDRQDLRLGLIVNGATVTDPKTKVKTVLSTGISKTTYDDLERTGGLIGQTYSKLQATAADYGIELTHTDLLNRARKALLPGGVATGISTATMDTGITQEANSIKQAAKIRFANLAGYIDQGLKVSDIASNYQRLKENEYGLVNNAVNIYDTDVQKALSGEKVASNNDFILGIRSNPAWRKTPKANEMAATFVNTLLKSWGKVG
jgi:hypothetical protein